MEINGKKTKITVMNGTGRIKHPVKFIGGTLEWVTRFTYLESWITKGVRNEEDIRLRVDFAKAAF